MAWLKNPAGQKIDWPSIHSYQMPIISYTPIAADSRLSALPIGRPEIYKVYEEAVAVHWNNKQIKYSEEAKHFLEASKGIQRLITSIVAFFATSDTLVNFNITESFEKEFDIPEVKWFYAQQKHIENEHSLTYSNFIQIYIQDPEERARIFDAVRHYKAIGRVREFIVKCASSQESAGCRLFRMACVEGVLFARAFAIVYYVCLTGKFPGLLESNQLISRDEGWHTVGAAVVHNSILNPEHKITREQAIEIIEEVDQLAAELGAESVMEPMQGMNEDLLRQYTRNQGNIVMGWFGHAPHFRDAENPFPFMAMLNLSSRANFFEVPETNYHTGHNNNTGQATTSEELGNFELTEDF